ncbi:bifunctional diguanylate cyclase/phosphodiesterase [Sulfurovum sp. AR]|uniref:putative bifunctional diguanylate cyclase/phosphodiesterase n=1 Tax=Sulfurovum sp. AR TaxID=1165841 RepID=UPI00025C481C|nr:EAL domain-containing protein [Sulfurovum sp. AR]EIF51664.1 diguanylate cyclase/phosphodiesterase [Sulfurovum sp. AR]
MSFKKLNLTFMVLFVGFFVITILLHYTQTVKHIHTIMIDNLRESVSDMKFDIKAILNNQDTINLKAYLDRQKAGSRMIKEIYVVKEDGTLLRTSDYLYEKNYFKEENTISLRQLNTDNISNIDLLRSDIKVIDHDNIVHYSMYVKMDKKYITNSVQQRIGVQIIYPLLFFIGVVIFYLLYIKNLIMKPIMIVDDFLRGIVQRIPKFYIREFNHLSQNLQNNLKELKELAYFDTLTGVYNRKAIEEILKKKIIEAKKNKHPFAVVMIDLDHFKKVNDNYGHDIGDLLLKEIAKVLQSEIRTLDHIGRLGGDEFLIIIDTINNVDIFLKLQKLIAKFKEPFHIEGNDIIIGMSIGGVMYPEDGNDVITLLKNVDIAMYQAKHEGRNRVVFFSIELGKKIQSEIELEKEIRYAFEHNEFSLKYQPIIDISSGKVVAVEALIRWEHPVKGTIYPTEFIPFVEKGCCVKEIGVWVFDRACKQQKEWSKNGIDVNMSINLSVKHMHATNFYDVMNAIIKKYDVDIKKISLEITEYTLMQYRETTMAMLNKMQHDGMTFRLDDFGTGYSSLTYLKDTPISSIKIDKSFIDGITPDKKPVHLLNAIINLSHAIDVTTIAEGVEEAYQVEYLKEIGCDMIQGYYYSKALDGKAFESYYQSRESDKEKSIE